MPRYRIHRLKENQKQHFRWTPHTSGTTSVKPRDYQESDSVEAASAYSAWAALRETEQALALGDLLEAEDGSLSICKYVGFEEARWVLPEEKPAPEPAVPAASGQTIQ